VIVDLPGTTTSRISRALVELREEGGAVALGRVLTLIIVARPGDEEEAIEAANDASREHPMRVIVLSRDEPQGEEERLDGQIRVGGDAGAGEVIVLRVHGAPGDADEGLVTSLLLPDAPVVVWWTGEHPDDMGSSPLGRIAQRRIADSAASADPLASLTAVGLHYRPGDTDFAWTRLTLWRAQLAAALDQPPYEPVTAARVRGSVDSASTALIASWLGSRLQLVVDVEMSLSLGSSGVHSVELERPSGPIVLERVQEKVAELRQPGQPVHELALPRRHLRDCLAEELRHLDPDELFGEVVAPGAALYQANVVPLRQGGAA